jgi:hypothetical protein
VIVKVAPFPPDDARDASTTDATAPAVAALTAPPSAHTLAATNAEDSASDDVRASPQPIATPWPWYRREPWLAVALASFVPIGVGFALPQQHHYLLLGMSAVLVVLSIAMLIREGRFREHPKPVSTTRSERRAMPVPLQQGVG